MKVKCEVGILFQMLIVVWGHKLSPGRILYVSEETGDKGIDNLEHLVATLKKASPDSDFVVVARRNLFKHPQPPRL